MAERYRSELTNEKFDVIIVGSGLGGLALAAVLAKEGKIDVCEVSSPLTTEHFANYQKGEIYGLEHAPKVFRVKLLRAQTPIKNLYMTGQDVVTVGIGGALMSGLITGASMTKINFIDKVVKSTNQFWDRAYWSYLQRVQVS